MSIAHPPPDTPGQGGGADFSAIDGLLVRHYEMLRNGSGLSDDVIRERGYRSILGRKALAELGFTKAQQRAPGLLLPVWTPDGRNGLHSYRPDEPRVNAEHKELKYEIPAGAGVRLDVPPRCRAVLADPSVPLWLTESQKKADALATHGLCSVGLLGVWNFKGKNEFGGVTLLADFDYIALNGRQVRICFDSDVLHKRGIRDALARLTEHLQRKGATVVPVYLPDGPDCTKQGVDDYLVAHSTGELEKLVEHPRPAPKAAPPAVELLDEMPPALGRPLVLIDGVAFGATWLPVRTTVRETLDKQGQVVRHDPPIVQTRREPFVLRSDGVVFGPGGDKPLDALGLEWKLADPPREGKTLHARGVAAYRRGERRAPADVFRRAASVYDTFIDFALSLADQASMCELSACFSLATWLAPAFTVLGYPWPNGERGSGKTHWGTCWAETSYLGEVLLSSGSFAALRDLADYGAALCFDDAEALSDPKRCDPQKRELLLAGNRRGARIPLKEPAPDGRGWQTRWVNAFCPRAFTAINIPDPVLASRSIIVPLARTADPARGNADPADPKRWPCDQRHLVDDLWCVALALLPEAEQAWAELEHEDQVTGREFEPWRAVLTVARLFERHGLDGLEGRIRGVMAAYQREKHELLDNDRTVLVVKALAVCAISAVSAVSAVNRGTSKLTATHVSDEIKRQAEADERAAEWATSRRVGRILKRLRLQEDRSGGRRGWLVTVAGLDGLQRAYGLAPAEPGEMHAQDTGDPRSINGTNVQNDTNGTGEDELAWQVQV